MADIVVPSVIFSGTELTGPGIDRLSRRIGDLGDIYNDKAALADLPADQLVYEVASYFPIPEGTTAGLFFGITYIHPGKVGREYFMTKGHFHQLRDRGEMYICVEGNGMLILMDENRKTHAEKMYPGSVHYINGYTAHRTANTGDSILTFSAVWPSDAGHDYDTISTEGFSKILVEQDGEPVLLDNHS
ncbi:MAG: glucose-6-phosphate isomerase family protein [Chitinophagaceae bacterium]